MRVSRGNWDIQRQAYSLPVPAASRVEIAAPEDGRAPLTSMEAGLTGSQAWPPLQNWDTRQRHPKFGGYPRGSPWILPYSQALA